MKKIVLLVLACLPAFAFAQDNKYIVQGTLGTYNTPAKVYLRYRFNGKVTTDSVTLKNGKFLFSGRIGNSPVNGFLMLNPKGAGPIYDGFKSVYIEKGIRQQLPQRHDLPCTMQKLKALKQMMMPGDMMRLLNL